jgi:hypothetical protein
MERERGTGHETPAVETSRKMQRKRTTHRRSWRLAQDREGWRKLVENLCPDEERKAKGEDEH